MTARRPRGGLLVVLGGLLTIIGVASFTVVSLVRWRLLDTGYYRHALTASDAYDRVYTDVLADPQLSKAADQLIARTPLRSVGTYPGEQRAALVAALRRVLPPSAIRDGSDTTIDELVRYVRGDTDTLSVTVALDDALARMPQVATDLIEEQLASAPFSQHVDLEQLPAVMSGVASTLARGELPSDLPSFDVSPEGVDAIMRALQGPLGISLRPELAQQIRAYLEGGDGREAVLTAAAAYWRTHVDDVVADLRHQLDAGSQLDLRASLKQFSHTYDEHTVDALRPLRLVAEYSTLPVQIGSLLVAALGIAIASRRRGGAGVLLTAGGTLGVSAGFMACGFVVLGGLFTSPLQHLASDNASRPLPAGLRVLLRDVNQHLVADVGDLAFRLVVAFGLLAIACTVAGLLLHAPTRRPAFAVAGATACSLALVAWAPWSPESAGVRRCNGHAELCDRPYSQVVQAATHNSMASADQGFVLPEQDSDIRAQLEAGVRTLLIDTHYWTPVASASTLEANAPEYAGYLEQNLSLGTGRPGTYLCHKSCALGASPLVDELRSIGSFLRDNPDDVVTLIIQDAVTRADTVDAFEAAGVERYLYTPNFEKPHEWPTLGEMIDKGRRLVVFAQSSSPPPAWYLPAFQFMQETPFRFASPAAMSCAPNRGRNDAELFLMNNWVTRAVPDRADAAVVNSADFIIDRAIECSHERGMMPNFIAVNFASTGALVQAVDHLNGVANG